MQTPSLRPLAALLFAAALSAPAWADKAAAQKLNTAWDQAFNRGDAAALAKLYAPNAVVSPGNGKTLTGRDEIQKLFKSFFDNGFHNHKIEMVDVHSDGKLMHQVARWSANGPEKDGKKPTIGGVLASAFQRSGDGQWQQVAHIWNAGSD